MGITENSANQVSDPELQGNAPPGAQGTGSGLRSDAAPAGKDVTPRGSDAILDRAHLGEQTDDPGQPGPAPRDSDDGASKDSRDEGNNGNPAQSAGRVSMQEQNRAPENPAKINTPEEA